jgi:PAS domain S-box-containing protein
MSAHELEPGGSSSLASELQAPSTGRIQTWLNAVLQSSKDALIIIDGHQHISLLNREAERLFACGAKQLLSKPVDTLFPADARHRCRRRLLGARAGEKLQLEGLRAGSIRFRFNASVSGVSDGGERFQVIAMRESLPGSPALRRRADSCQQAYELEKRRVSRELYDELGQRLSVLKLDMDWLECNLPATAELNPSRIAQMQALLDSVIIRTKAIASGLRPPLLDDLGLLEAVRWLAQSFEKQTGICCEINRAPLAISSGDAVDTAIYRVVQEALLNIQRHAHASHVRIEIRYARDCIEVLIQDNGIGMPRGAEYKAGCFGLVAMQERIYTLGGAMDIRSREGQGSAIHVSIPVEPIAAKLRTS